MLCKKISRLQWQKNTIVFEFNKFFTTTRNWIKIQPSWCPNRLHELRHHKKRFLFHFLWAWKKLTKVGQFSTRGTYSIILPQSQVLLGTTGSIISNIYSHFTWDCKNWWHIMRNLIPTLNIIKRFDVCRRMHGILSFISTATYTFIKNTQEIWISEIHDIWANRSTWGTKWK